MDSQNIISITGDLEKLDLDMINWQSLTFAQRKRSDDACISKYGRTNTELYELLRKNIELSSTDASLLSEGSLELEIKKTDIDSKLDKMNSSKRLQKEFGFVIIDPWILDNVPEYTLEELESKYNLFLSSAEDIKKGSNSNSIELWGYDVHNMYNIMKNKILDLEYSKKEKDDPEFHLPTNDLQLSEYTTYVKSEIEHSDLLHKKLRYIDCLSYKGTVYEEAVLERLSNEINESCKNSFANYSEDIPLITPWFTPDELEALTNKEIEPFEYIIGNRDTVSLNENIKKAMYELSIATESDIEEKTKNVISLGWNPSVPYNEHTISYARQRQINWLRENKYIEFIDISEFFVLDEDKIEVPIVQLEPVYIVLINHEGINSKIIRAWTKSNYSHAGISLDENLDKIYSYNMTGPDGSSGFGIESLRFYKRAKDPNLKVMTFFVEPNVKMALKEKIDYFVKNKDKTSYSISNIFRIILNKTKDTSYSLSLVCSQFVDTILKMVNLDISGKPSNLVVPGDFDKSNMNKMFITYNGKVKGYKPSIVKKKITKLLSSNLFPDSLIVKPIGETMERIFVNKDLESLFVETGDPNIDVVLSEIRSILTPTAVITEAKPLPVRFGKKGDLFIDLPRDLELEYQEAHRLLESYNENNIEGIKHQLARLFYINSIIERKIKKMKKGDESYKELIDLRARVINDFKKYIKLVQSMEKNFDFELYMKNSEYYNKTVMVDRHTMKYSGKLISNLIKLMV